jgi:hypothetical protein
MQKTGQIERTVDREFADEEAKFKTCVSSTPLLDGIDTMRSELQLRERMPGSPER